MANKDKSGKGYGGKAKGKGKGSGKINSWEDENGEWGDSAEWAAEDETRHEGTADAGALDVTEGRRRI